MQGQQPNPQTLQQQQQLYIQQQQSLNQQQQPLNQQPMQQSTKIQIEQPINYNQL